MGTTGDPCWSPSWTRYRDEEPPRFFRGDASFANPELYDYLQDEGFRIAIRLKANPKLHPEIEHLLKRPVGRPPTKPLVRFHSFLYQAAGWRTSRRVVAKIEHHQGELFSRIGFIVTNLSRPPSAVVRFYNGRGLTEQWIKEGMGAAKYGERGLARESRPPEPSNLA